MDGDGKSDAPSQFYFYYYYKFLFCPLLCLVLTEFAEAHRRKQNKKYVGILFKETKKESERQDF